MSKQTAIELEDECLESLLGQFVAKNERFQKQMSFSVGQIEACIRIAFLRGIDAGKELTTPCPNG